MPVCGYQRRPLNPIRYSYQRQIYCKPTVYSHKNITSVQTHSHVDELTSLFCMFWPTELQPGGGTADPISEKVSVSVYSIYSELLISVSAAIKWGCVELNAVCAVSKAPDKDYHLAPFRRRWNDWLKPHRSESHHRLRNYKKKLPLFHTLSHFYFKECKLYKCFLVVVRTIRCFWWTLIAKLLL